MNKPVAAHRTGTFKFFELGNFPDKGFSLDEEEADAAIALFEGADMTLNHDRDPEGNPLKGMFGRAKRIFRKGKDLFAEVEIPSWLSDQILAAGRSLRLSAEWRRQSKTLVRIAWVLNPRIKDAIAAFSVVNDPPAKPRPAVKPKPTPAPVASVRVVKYSTLRRPEKPKPTQPLSAETIYEHRRKQTGGGLPAVSDTFYKVLRLSEGEFPEFSEALTRARRPMIPTFPTRFEGFSD